MFGPQANDHDGRFLWTISIAMVSRVGQESASE